jgi:hypothetical protein
MEGAARRISTEMTPKMDSTNKKMAALLRVRRGIASVPVPTPESIEAAIPLLIRVRSSPRGVTARTGRHNE